MPTLATMQNWSSADITTAIANDTHPCDIHALYQWEQTRTYTQPKPYRYGSSVEMYDYMVACPPTNPCPGGTEEPEEECPTEPPAEPHT